MGPRFSPRGSSAESPRLRHGARANSNVDSSGRDFDPPAP